MSKPLFRWTVGSCLPQGLAILAESINRTTRALGIDNWDWAVCHNGLNRDDLEFLTKAIGDRPIQLIAQNWATCPVPDNCQTPRRRDGSFEWNGNRCGGTLWKVCPARMRMESHEIVMDNDVVMLQAFPQIQRFLQEDKALVLEEPIRFYGRYDCLFGSDPPYLNSGFLGFPPGYDYGSKLFETWVKHGRYENISQSDEQGLLTYTLSQHPNIRIGSDQMVEVLHRDFKTQLTGREQAIHFTQSNRIPNHHQWAKYQEIVNVNSIM
jgi:hypothetical protein